MNKNFYIVLLIIVIMTTTVFADTTLNYITATQLNTQKTNNNYTFIGFKNNTDVFFGNINNTNRFINLTSGSDAGNIYNNAYIKLPVLCNAKNNSDTNSGTNQIYPNNATVCYSNVGTVRLYYPNGTSSSTPTFSNYQMTGITSFNGTYYMYTNDGNPVLFRKRLFPSYSDYPALNCYSEIQTVLLNNFGVNTSAYGGITASMGNGTLIQDADGVFYFKVGTHWFYFEEDGSNTCSGIAGTLQEASITLPTVYLENKQYEIVNDNLYTIGKDNSSNVYVYTSGNVNTTAGLLCNDLTTYCINQTGYCVQPIFGPDLVYYCTNNNFTESDEAYCLGESYSTYCTAGCNNVNRTNAYGVTYEQGICNQTGSCTNDCNTIGQSYSDSLLTYQICGFYDTDSCLDYATVTCNTTNNEISINGRCEVQNNTGTITTLKGFTTTPYQISETLFTIDSESYTSIPPKYSISSSGSSIILPFRTSTSSYPYYLSRDCNFTTTTLYGNDSGLTFTYTNVTNNIYTPTFTDGTFNIRLIPDENTGVLFEAYDELGNQLYKYYLYRNTTGNGECLYTANTTSNYSSLLGCSLFTGDPVQYIDFSIIQVYQGSMTQMIIRRGGSGVFTLYTSGNNNIDMTSLKLRNISVTGSYYYAFINVKNDIDTNALALTLVNTSVYNDTTKTLCILNTVGCRTVRTYYLNPSINERTLFNYKDWEICVNRLGDLSIPSTSTSTGIFSKFTVKTKILLALGIPFGLFLIGVLVAVLVGMAWITYVSAFFSIGLLIYYSVIGWLPAWIVIIMALTSSFIVVMIIRGLFAGKDEM